jgi:hypothetical protein
VLNMSPHARVCDSPLTAQARQIGPACGKITPSGQIDLPAYGYVFAQELSS